ncbi:MAG: ROK family protein [Ignavibacteria bacterium]|nr:ROK family protein [Ignavibacteria bacterium]
MNGAIDIGGTNIKYGVVSHDGSVLWDQSKPTLAAEGRDAVVDRLRGVVQQIRERTPEVESIGIGVPGVVDPVTKHVQAPPNLPGWVDVDLSGRVTELRRYGDTEIRSADDWFGERCQCGGSR